MRRAALSLTLVATLLVGCASDGSGPQVSERAVELSAPVALAAGVVWMASELEYLEPEYLAGMLVAYAIYDPLAPTWKIDVSRAGEDRLRMDLRMKSLVTGGEGEARQVVEAGGFAGFDVLRYEEGIESTRPFARRFASGEIRLVRSRAFPEL